MACINLRIFIKGHNLFHTAAPNSQASKHIRIACPGEGGRIEIWRYVVPFQVKPLGFNMI